MTSTVLPGQRTVDDPRRTAVGPLARLEASTMLRRASIWIGAALSVLLIVTSALAQEEWSSQKYTALVPLGVFPMTIAAYVAGVRSGNRDRSPDGGALADEAPLGGDERATARLASLIVPAAFVAAAMLIVGLVSRIEGGFWVGDGRFRTDSALHSIFELMQPSLIVTVVGAAAIAIGRGVVRAGPAIVIGVVVLFASASLYWVLNTGYASAIALTQVQPLDGLDVIHIPTVIFHDLYLVGLVCLFAGLALRGAARPRLVLGGGALAAVSVAVQLAVMPL